MCLTVRPRRTGVCTVGRRDGIMASADFACPTPAVPLGHGSFPRQSLTGRWTHTTSQHRSQPPAQTLTAHPLTTGLSKREPSLLFFCSSRMKSPRRPGAPG